MIDTGADVAVISANTWPQSGPTIAVGSVVASLGGTTQSYLSNRVLVKNPEEQPAMIHPCMWHCCATHLWEGDVLSAWGVHLGPDFFFQLGPLC